MRRVEGRANAARRSTLSQRLRSLMQEQGLSVTELAKRMELELPGERFNPVNLSHYKAGRSVPRPRYLNALSRVLGVLPQDLIPPAPEAGSEVEQLEPTSQTTSGAPAFRIEDLADGQALLQINQALPWPQVLKILDALKGK